MTNMTYYSNDMDLDESSFSSSSCWGPNVFLSSNGTVDLGRNSEDGIEEIFDNSKTAAAFASATLTNKIKDFIEETNKEDGNTTILPWHKLLSIPAKQMIVVDRMHSGAR